MAANHDCWGSLIAATKCSYLIIDLFEATNNEMNITKQTVFNSLICLLKLEYELRKLLDERLLQAHFFQISTAEVC